MRDTTSLKVKHSSHSFGHWDHCVQSFNSRLKVLNDVLSGLRIQSTLLSSRRIFFSCKRTRDNWNFFLLPFVYLRTIRRPQCVHQIQCEECAKSWEQGKGKKGKKNSESSQRLEWRQEWQQIQHLIFQCVIAKCNLIFVARWPPTFGAPKTVHDEYKKRDWWNSVNTQRKQLAARDKTQVMALKRKGLAFVPNWARN